MTQTAAMRATSLVASGVMLGGAVLAALTMSVAFLPPAVQTIDTPPIMIERPEPPPPPITHQNPALPREIIIEGEALEALPPLETTKTEVGTEIVGPVGPEIISRPHWLRTPRDLQSYYPRRAMRAEVEGDVLLDCLVTTQGALQCVVVSETPANWGFAAAAVRISNDYRMSPAMRGGVPVEGRYRMRVPFRVE